MNGVLEHDFDMIDRFIARYHLDTETTGDNPAILKSSILLQWR
jgi:propanediol dehydratase large subunit